MRKKPRLPSGYRISTHTLRKSDAGDPYDWGEWTYRLDVYETRTVGYLWWKRQVTQWWPVEYHNDREMLNETAYMREKKGGL